MSIISQQQVTYRPYSFTAAAAMSLQSCPTLCDPRDGSPPDCPSLGLSRQEHYNIINIEANNKEINVEVKNMLVNTSWIIKEITIKILKYYIELAVTMLHIETCRICKSGISKML